MIVAKDFEIEWFKNTKQFKTKLKDLPIEHDLCFNGTFEPLDGFDSFINSVTTIEKEAQLRVFTDGYYPGSYYGRMSDLYFNVFSLSGTMVNMIPVFEIEDKGWRNE